MKSSFRVLKWSLLAAVIASLASACVVTSGDGDIDDDFGEGGDGGTKTNTGGSKTAGSSNAGANTGGTTSNGGDTSSEAGTPAMGTAGADTGGGFVPGECQEDEPLTPTIEPSCDPVDGDDACTACIKAKACSEFKTCFGEEPTTACGTGMAAGEDGQWACITKCFAENEAGSVDDAMLLEDCSASCTGDCGGLPNDETQALIAEANQADTCQAECFPF